MKQSNNEARPTFISQSRTLNESSKMQRLDRPGLSSEDLNQDLAKKMRKRRDSEGPGRLLQVLSRTSRGIGLVTLGFILIHVTMTMIDFFFLQHTLFSSGTSHPIESFIKDFTSGGILKITLAYALLSLAVYYPWQRTKRAIIRAYDRDMAMEREKAILKMAQRITGLIAQHISGRNSAILAWVERRRSQKQQPPKMVAQSSQDIAELLQLLTEISFIEPYTKRGGRFRSVEDYAHYLESKLAELDKRISEKDPEELESELNEAETVADRKAIPA